MPVSLQLVLLHRSPKSAILLLVLSLLVPLASGTPAQASIDVNGWRYRCAVGAQRIDVALVEFADVSHTTTIDHYEQVIANMNASFFSQSYGKIWLTGSVRGWYKLDRPISDYGNLDRWAGAIPLETVLELERSAIQVAGRGDVSTKLILVLSGGKDGSGAWALEGNVAVLRETHSYTVFMHELAHLLGLPDLYLYGTDRPLGDPTNGLDNMGNSNYPGYSSWSKIKLCWMPKEWILVVNVNTKLPKSAYVALLSDAKTGIHVVKVTWGSERQYALVERNYGTSYLFFVDESRDSGRGIVTHNATFSRMEVVVEESRRFSLVSVGSGTVAVDTVLHGRTAQNASKTIANAETAIRGARNANRLLGLDEAEASLKAAEAAFERMSYDEASERARTATDIASSATVPASAQAAEALIRTARAQLSDIAAGTFTTPKSIELFSSAKSSLHDAEVAFERDHFDEANASAQKVLRLLEEANAAENTTKIQENQQRITLSVAIASVVLVFALAVALAARSKNVREKPVRPE